MTRVVGATALAGTAGAVPSPTPTHGLADLSRNRRVFDRLLNIAERRARAGRAASALEWCRIAASFAMTNATGELRSGRLERVIDAVAEQRMTAHGRPVPPLARTAGERPRVLHVLTEAAEIGGLTRLAERWITEDAGRTSSVVVVRQTRVPDALRMAAAASGGAAYVLGNDTALGAARRLRNLARETDTVICHLQPDDHTTAAAFGAGYAGAPVAVFNHADHVFWVAPTRATLLVDFRDVGAALSRDGRGYGEEAGALLPLLVPPSSSTSRRAVVRDGLGVADDRVLAVSVARSIKFQDTALTPTFAELVVTMVEADPRVVFCAVGADGDEQPWQALRKSFPGRVHAVGPTPDPQGFLDAADIYLDPYPFSSLTSLLEAAASALPTVTFDGHRGLRRTLGIADFVPTPADRPRDVVEYRRRVRRLAVDAAERAAGGVRAREGYDALGSPERWRARVDELYLMLQARAAGPGIGASPPPVPGADLIDYGLALLAVEQRVPVLYTVGAGLRGFDRRDRAVWRLRTLAARAVRKAVGSAPGRTAPWDHALLLGAREGLS